MTLLEKFHIILLCIQFFTALAIFFSANPMHSILFMILLFFESAILLSFFNLEFFALLIVLVYVGAVAVLFLFVVMLLDIKTESYNFYILFNITFILSVFCMVKSYNFFINFFYADGFFNSFLETHSFSFDTIEEIQILGQALYNSFLPCILIAGLILLFAMIGAIALTYNYNGRLKTSKFACRHLGRCSSFLLFFQ